MRSPSIFTARPTRRLCAFCRQQQQQQQRHIATMRSLYASSASQQSRESSSPLASSHSRGYRMTQSSTAATRQRPFSQSATFRNDGTASTSTTTQQQQPASTTNDTNNEDSKPKVPLTHYDFFPETLPAGPPPQGPLEIDVRALRREFLALQSGAHPDLHPHHMKARAQATSARINEAYKTLSHPLSRAQYVLSLQGMDVAGDETAKVEDPELLMLVLETRECIEEAAEEGDLVELREENEERIEASVKRLGELFAVAGQRGEGKEGEEALREARDETVRLRYWVNVRESIDNWEKGKPVVLEH
ncbi:Co-chaperone Hsc20 [Xylaria sp. FL0064]|nr:Co-chaperone Hsc20 [Xylaria sp. FL0064]